MCQQNLGIDCGCIGNAVELLARLIDVIRPERRASDVGMRLRRLVAALDADPALAAEVRRRTRQVLASLRALQLDPGKVNPAGGAIALGHPLGCSGARIVTTLVHNLRRTGKRYGLATMCIGVGQGIASVVERL